MGGQVTLKAHSRESAPQTSDTDPRAATSTEVGHFERDLRTGRAWWSPGLRELLGMQPNSEAHLQRGLTYIFGADLPAVREAIENASDGHASTVRHRYWRGRELRLGQSAYQPIEEGGDVVGLSGTFQDITAAGVPDGASVNRDFLATLLATVDVAVAAADTHSRVTHWNPAAERLFGWPAEEVLGRTVPELRLGPDASTGPALLEAVRRTGSWEGERRIRRKDGTEAAVYMRVTQICASDGSPVGIVGVSFDISREVEARRETEQARDHLQAVTDSMAEGLFTLDERGRVSFINRAGQRMLGWTQDELAGEAIHGVVHHRHRDGSEFPPRECPIYEVQRSGEEVRVADDMFIRRDGSELDVSYTATPLREGARRNGVVVVFEDVTERRAAERKESEKIERLAWVGRIREGLERSWFVPYAQPIVDLATGQTIEHELLVRMIGRDGRPVAPAEFLPVAEEHGLIVDIDKMMLEHAIRLAGSGHALTLNLSGQTIATPDMADFFAERLKAAELDPSLLVVEVTETALIENEQAAKRFLSCVSELGCRFALDDFGTGYGGFTYLKHLSVDFLKIDREFVSDLTENQASQRVVAAVVELARGFGQKTIAEGVEDPDAVQTLSRLGVDYGQGYLFGRPAPATEAIERKDSETS